MFKPSSGKLTNWSRQAAEHGLPKQWTERRSKVINIQFNPSCHELMMLQDHSMFTILDLREVAFTLYRHFEFVKTLDVSILRRENRIMQLTLNK